MNWEEFQEGEGFSEQDALETAKQVAYDCAKSVQFAGHLLKGPELVLRIWESTAGAIFKEVETGRNIFVFGLGTFGLKAQQLIFAPQEEFLNTHSLDPGFFLAQIPQIPRPSTALVASAVAVPRSAGPRVEEMATLAAKLDLLPRTKHSVATVARLLEISSELVLQALQAMVHRMGQQMATDDLALSFAPLGTFFSRQKHLSFRPDPAAARAAAALSPGLWNFGPTIPLRKLLSTVEKRKSKLARGPVPPPKAGRLRPQPRGRDRVSTGEGRWERSLPGTAEVYPDLLNEYSRTPAAPFVGMEDPGSPSTRIASSFTASASRLTWKPCQRPKRSLRWQPHFLEQPFLVARSGEDYSKHFTRQFQAGSPLDLELQEAKLSRQRFFETFFRYHYYFDTIPDSYLAPFSDRWSQQIVRRLALTLSEEEDMLMEDMWQEVLQDYRQAIRKVIIEHVLKDEKAKERTGILFVPSPVALWGSEAFLGIEGTAGGLPEGWESIEKRRVSLADQLIPCSPASLSLLEAWHQNYDTLLLVNLPEISGDLMDLQTFCAAQTQKMKSVRASLEQWLGDVVEILKQTPQQLWPITLLCTQVRGIVDRSIDAFLDFFGPSRQVEAFLRVNLQAKGDQIVLTTSLEEIEVSLLQVFKDFVVSLSDLSFTVNDHTVTLWSVTLEEAHVQDALQQIAESILQNLAQVEEALAPFDQFKHLLVEDVRIKKLSEDTLTQDHVMQELKTLRSVQQSIRSTCAEEIRLSMVSIQCSQINETLQKKAEEAIYILQESILRHLLLRNEELCKRFEMVVNQVVKKPTSEMELVDLEMYIEEFRTTGLGELLKEYDSIREWLLFLFACENQLMLALLKEKHFQAMYDSAMWVGSIQYRVFFGTNLTREREALESKFKEQRNKFLEDLEGYNEQVEQLAECGNLRQVDEYLERMENLKNNFARAHIEAEKLNAKEKRFGWEVRSPFEQLKRGELALEPHFALWTLAANMEASMRSWLKGPMFHLDPSKVDFDVRQMRKEAIRLKELFVAGGGVVYPDSEAVKSIEIMEVDFQGPTERERPLPVPAQVADQLAVQAATMQETHLKLLYSLCNKAMQTRHWEEITRIVGFPLEPDAAFTLQKALEMDVPNFADEIQEISEASTKEYAIEVAADEMEHEWKTLSFALNPWKQTGAFVISEESMSQLTQLVEHQQSHTEELMASEDAEPWEERLEEWQEWLQSMSEMLARWEEVQALWINLEPLFSGRDVYKQLPGEIQTFRKVDKTWRHLTTSLVQHPVVKEMLKMKDLEGQLSEAAQSLQSIQERISSDS